MFDVLTTDRQARAAASRNILGAGLLCAVFLASPVHAQACVAVDRVDLRGVTLLDAGALQAQLSARMGCVDLGGLNDLLETVTLAYVEAGYIAARAYLPEQDLSDGTLTIAVVEGKLSAINLRENGTPAPRRASTAFPGIIGSPLQLRELEQGLAQINRLRSSDAVSALEPGAEAGETVLSVDVTQGSPWSGSASMDNRGSETTGRFNLGAALTYDDLFGLNDVWTLSTQRSMEPSPLALGTDVPVGRSLSLSGSVPYGFWTFGVAASASDYVTDIPGITGPIESTGQSGNLRLSADRVLSVTQTGRWDAGVSLEVKENENQILGATIDTASRRLSVLDLWLSRSQPVLGGQGQARLTYRQGLDAFAAFDDDTAPPGSPKAEYDAVLFDLSWARQWDVGAQAVVLNSRISGQYSDDNLFGSEQLSVGGFGGVRGTRTGVLFGNRGAQITNTFSLPDLWQDAAGWRVAPYLGLDAGYVAAQDDFGIAGGHLAAWSVGATLASQGGFSLDTVYSEVFDASSNVDAPAGVFSVMARIGF
ncbi:MULTISPECIES: ShlB/FhaC/HecB family hemolysin secretion/activation protein [unclassified Yoonia]|uniref:ShlB/FhaC/HecB family hemolysin secretion/activation protein n=1 Tax=unclassified Yoonia TaxID=2629118 RepID=UPI002AFF52C3|nr:MULTISPECIES: ShlB/FhaC/HecB family hemolysin secretion/activation protein [unclassified Yoonia]